MTLDPRDILQELVDTPLEQRAARMAELCGEDEALQQEVRNLLTYAGFSGDLLDSLGIPGAWDAEPELPESIGPWQIEGRLGWGATGVVYAARRGSTPGTEEPAVALKVFRGGLVTPESGKRFQAEARALSRLSHPGIPRLLDSGTIELPTGPVPFVATEIVEGRALRQVLAGGRLAPTDALRILAELAGILEYAHVHQVIHRDLKPDNIMIGSDGQPRILDFGLARLVAPEATSMTLTRVGQIIGTIPYMSPEQAHAGGKAVDARSDLYSLGVVAFEMLAGRLPYDVPADSIHRAIVAILTTEPQRLGALVPECRGNIEAIVHRLLAKSPEERYQSAAELRIDLQRHHDGKSIRPLRLRTKSRRLRRIVALAGALAVLVALGAVLQHGQSAAARERTAVAEVMRDMTRAATLVHVERDRPGALEEATAILDRAQVRLDEIGGPRGFGKLTLLLRWRQGEAHLLLGQKNWDREELHAAERAWGAAWGYGDPKIEVPLDRSLPLAMEIEAFPYSLIATGMTGAQLALAELESPLPHARFAVQDAENTPRWLLAEFRAAPAGSGIAGERFREYCMSLNSLAAGLLLRGRLLGNLADVDSALAHAGTADRLWDPPTLRPPKASMVQNIGEAWMARAAITGSAAELDSSRAHLERALTYRPAQENPRAFRETHAALARLALQVAAGTSSFEGRQRVLTAALERLRIARDLAPQVLNQPREACYDVLEAELAVAAAAAGISAEAAIADTLLTRAAPILTSSRYPLQHADLQRVRALVHEHAWRTTASEEERAQAARCLRVAREIRTEGDDPAGHRAIEMQLARLESAGVMHPASGPSRARAAATPAPTSTGFAPNGRNVP